MTSNKRTFLLASAFAAALMLAGCIPEANRERGGDAGGDIGNWGQPVRMHGEKDVTERVFYETPRMGQGIERSEDEGAVSPES